MNGATNTSASIAIASGLQPRIGSTVMWPPQNTSCSRRTPVTQVQAAPQRNQKSARGSSSGFTFFLVSPSCVPWKGMFTKLKKYSMPIQTMPASTWIQRERALRISMSLPPM